MPPPPFLLRFLHLHNTMWAWIVAQRVLWRNKSFSGIKHRQKLAGIVSLRFNSLGSAIQSRIQFWYQRNMCCNSRFIGEVVLFTQNALPSYSPRFHRSKEILDSKPWVSVLKFGQSILQAQWMPGLKIRTILFEKVSHLYILCKYDGSAERQRLYHSQLLLYSVTLVSRNTSPTPMS